LQAKGDNACLLASHIKQARREMHITMQSGANMEHMVLIGREVDYLSCLLSQHTYGGQIEELYNDYALARKAAITPTADFDQPGEAENHKFTLNSRDHYYQILCGLTMPNVGNSLEVEFAEHNHRHDQFMQQLEQWKDNGDPGTATKIAIASAEMADFDATLPLLCSHRRLYAEMTGALLQPQRYKSNLAKLIKGANTGPSSSEEYVDFSRKDHQNLEQHLVVLQELFDSSPEWCLEYLEEMMSNECMARTLAFICLCSQCSSKGLTADHVTRIKCMLKRAYGFKAALTLDVLLAMDTVRSASSIGWIGNAGSKKVVETFKQQRPTEVELLKESAEVQSQGLPPPLDDIPLLTPLSCKLLEMALDNEWDSRAQDLRLLPGGELHEHAGGHLRAPPPPPDFSPSEMFQAPPKQSVVVFVGGCTWDEIAAVRRQAHKRGMPILIVTTAVMTSHHFIRAAEVDWMHD